MKKIWRQKIILSILTLAIFLMPITPALQTKKAKAVNTVEATEKAEATNSVEALVNTTISAKIGSQTSNSITYRITAKPDDPNTTLKDFNDGRHLFVLTFLLLQGQSKPTDTQTYIEQVKGIDFEASTNSTAKSPKFVVDHKIENLKTNQRYFVVFLLSDKGYNPDGNWFQSQSTYSEITKFAQNNVPITEKTFTLGSTLEQTQESETQVSVNSQVAFDFDCGIRNLGGCIAQIFYVFWQVSAWIARLAGQFLDFFIYYSTNDSSYRNDFIKEGWKAIRDIVNIFFIIALLFVAIKTILSLNDGKSKKIIGYVVLIALLINFSLFFTQVIIDSSNILAKIFYNDIKGVNEDGSSAVGVAGEKSISVGLVDLFDPQGMVGPEKYEELGAGKFIFIILAATFITIATAFIFFSVALMFVARVISLWLAMIFAPLAFISYTLPFKIPTFGYQEWWSNLIKNAFLAPIFIFFLYIIVMFAGFLDKIGEYTPNPGASSGEKTMQIMMSIAIPFAILYGMLKTAKSIAVDYSGKLGKEISSMGKKALMVAGGAAVGVAAGGLAIAGRATIGRAGSALVNSERLKKQSVEGKTWVGRQVASGLRGFGKSTSKGNMDIRGVSIGGKNLGSTGLKVNTLGKPNAGGFAKMREDKVKKRMERAKELEVGKDEPLMKAINKTESDIQKLLKDNEATITKLDKQIEIRRQAVADATAEFGAGTPEVKKASTELNNAKNHKKALMEGKVYEGDKKYGEVEEKRIVKKTRPKTVKGDYGKDKIIQEEYEEEEKYITYKERLKTPAELAEDDGYGKITKYAEKENDMGTYTDKDGNTHRRTLDFMQKTELNERKNEIGNENRRRRGAYAEQISSSGNKVWNNIASFGQHSNKGADEAAHRIIMEDKLDSGTKV